MEHTRGKCWLGRMRELSDLNCTLWYVRDTCFTGRYAYVECDSGLTY